MKTFRIAALALVLSACSLASSAFACDSYVKPCYYKTVTLYKCVQKPYQVTVTKYDECGHPYQCRHTFYKTVKVPYTVRVKVCR